MRCALVWLLLAGVALSTAGCRSGEGVAPPDWLPVSAEATGTDAEEPDAPPAPEGSHGHGSEVLMMGRSVMAGWFDHWRYDYNSPVLRDGYALYYREVAGPPQIGTDAAAALAEVPEGTIVFFKLCFVDFWASSSADIAVNAEENLGYVRQVRDACEARGLTLVVGNALPQVSGSTTRELAETHLVYNAGLEALAAESADMTVFDMYGILAGDSGVLPKGLAVSPVDSHLNEVAYNMLDEEFFTLLDGLEK